MEAFNQNDKTVLNICITQKSIKGFLGGPRTCQFSCCFNDNKYHISIEQLLVRTITIQSDNPLSIRHFWLLFNLIDELIMLFEGCFIPVTRIAFDDGLTDLGNIENDLINGRLKMYFSADFMSINANYYLAYSDSITDETFKKWQLLSKELGIVHSMFLYNVSNVDMPIDIKCAYLIEIFKPLVELIQIYDSSFSCTDSHLRSCIEAVILRYGADIFHTESSADFKGFLKMLVNSRNRIMHIDRKQKNVSFLSGKESLIYCAKIACLYRHILLQLMGIDYSSYKDQLCKYIKMLDTHEQIVDNFVTTKLSCTS